MARRPATTRYVFALSRRRGWRSLRFVTIATSKSTEGLPTVTCDLLPVSLEEALMYVQVGQWPFCAALFHALQHCRSGQSVLSASFSLSQRSRY